MKKFDTLTIALTIAVLCGVGALGMALYKRQKSVAFDGNSLLEQIKPLVKYPDRVVLSPDNTNPGKFQLSYTAISEDSSESLAQELGKLTRESYKVVMKSENPISSVSIVYFNVKEKKGTRIILGRKIVEQDMSLLESTPEKLITSLDQKCKQTSAKDLSSFCNISDSLATVVKKM